VNSNALLLRALRGPLTLILVGALFVIDHADILSFSKTWPIIIIFLGVIRLAERAFPIEPPPFTPQGGAQ
jgi:hypothetical protein